MSNTKNKKSACTLLSKLLYCTALCFSLIVAALSLIGMIAGNEMMAALPCAMLLWTLLFSFLTAIAFAVSTFMKSKKINAVVNCAVHFVLTYAAFVLVYIVGGGAESYLGNISSANNKIFSIIMMTFCFIGVYAVVGLVRVAAATAKYKLSNRTKEYEGLYTEIEKTSSSGN